MEDRVQQRIARNETTLREVNEAIERGQWPGEEGSPTAFRCECAQEWCNELLEIDVAEYERVRGNSRWFVVLPGHEEPAAESVVQSGSGYVIVEKRDEAGRIAEARDPRAGSGR